MSHELICAWLGLPPEAWPPDHYRLLGLEPGENNAELIEQRVHERLETVRRYQMMHPEQATEAMNRLAQAFVCLTDASSKRAYDRTLLGAPVGAARPSGPPPLPEPPAPPRPPLAWLYPPPLPDAETLPPTADPTPTPPPLPPRAPVPPPLPPEWYAAAAAVNAVPPPLPSLVAPSVVPLPSPAPEPTEPPPEPIDPLIEAARSSPQARRGLGTKRALYYRVCHTRRLVRAWDRIGRYLAAPRRRLARRAEANDLSRQLGTVQDLLKNFPPLLGEAGQPGYLVLALAQVDLLPTFAGLSLSQREALGRDWQAGQKLLRAHRDFLRQELRAMRGRGLRARASRAVRAFLADQPGVVLLLLLALLALYVALWRTYAEWLQQF